MDDSIDMDKQFPVKQGTWVGVIPIIVPDLELKPTVQNAALCRVCYYISVRAQVKGGTDLMLRVPITVNSFPPKPIREQDATSEIESKRWEWDASVYLEKSLFISY